MPQLQKFTQVSRVTHKQCGAKTPAPANYLQKTESFECLSKEINNAVKLVNYQNYDWKQAAVDAILFQTFNPKLRERALRVSVSY